MRLAYVVRLQETPQFPFRHGMRGIAMADLRHHQALHAEFPSPRNGFVRREMGREEFSTKEKRGIKHECIQPLQLFRRARRNVTRVAYISKPVADAIAKCGCSFIHRMLNRERNHRHIADNDFVKTLDRNKLQAAQGLIATLKPLLRLPVGEHGEFGRESATSHPPIQKRKTAGSIRMAMREKDAVEFFDARFFQLFFDIRSRVDEERCLARADERGRASAPAFASSEGIKTGFVRMPFPWDTDRRAGAQKEEFHAFIVHATRFTRHARSDRNKKSPE